MTKRSFTASARRVEQVLIPKVILAACILLYSSVGYTADYYVDAASGRDSNAGDASKPWKTIGHAAGQVTAGDTVHVLPGDYPESVTIDASGSQGAPITFVSETRHAARLLGSVPVSGLRRCTSQTDCLGAPNWRFIYKSSVSERTIGADRDVPLMTEADRPLRNAWGHDTGSLSPLYTDSSGADPMKPLVDSRNAGSCDKLYDPSITQPDGSYYDGAYLWIWSHALNNMTTKRRITNWSDTEKSFTFAPALPAGRCLRPDATPSRSDAYMIANHPDTIRAPGDYVVTHPGPTRTILLWPLNGANDIDKVRINVLPRALMITGDWIVVDGFRILNYGQLDFTGTITARGANHLIVRNCHISVAHGEYLEFSSGTDNFKVENNIAHDARGYGLQFLGVRNGLIVGNDVFNTNRTSIYFAGSSSTHHVVAGNRIGSNGQHGNASAAYQCAGEILYVDNRIIGGTRITTNPCTHDIYLFRNVIETDGDFGVAFWSAAVTGDIKIYNNTLIRSTPVVGRDMMATGSNPNAATYEWVNNYISGSCAWQYPFLREHNAWRDDQKCWNQTASRGWSPGKRSFEDSAVGSLFADPSTSDYRPKSGSALLGTGVSIYAKLPRDIFPEFDFGADCASWNIGAYTCGAGPQPGVSHSSDYQAPSMPPPTGQRPAPPRLLP